MTAPPFQRFIPSLHHALDFGDVGVDRQAHDRPPGSIRFHHDAGRGQAVGNIEGQPRGIFGEISHSVAIEISGGILRHLLWQGHHPQKKLGDDHLSRCITDQERDWIVTRSIGIPTEESVPGLSVRFESQSGRQWSQLLPVHGSSPTRQFDLCLVRVACDRVVE